MRRLLWLPVVALLVLAARWLCYALAAPSPLSGRLEASAGGPRLVVVTLVSLGLAALLSAFAVWLAAVGVRERARLRPERVAPKLRLRRAALRFTLLLATSALAFALLESYVHWRAGLGFHGLSCLLGPVHRNAIPMLVALALAAAALAEAASHVLAWMRAVLRELGRPRLLTLPPAPLAAALPSFLVRLPASRHRSRAPPFPA